MAEGFVLRVRSVEPGIKGNPLLFGILAISVILLWGVAIAGSLSERRSAVRNAEDSLTRMTEVVLEQTSGLFGEVRVYLKLLDVWLQDNPGADPRTDPRFVRLVDSLRRAGRIKIDIRLVSRDDGLFYIPTPDPSKALAQVGDREYAKAQKDEATRGFYIAGPVLSRVTGIWGIPVSYPLTRSNAGMAVLFAAIELPTLNELYESARPKPDGSITLVRKDGIILARAPFDAAEVGRSLAAEPAWRTRREGFDRKVLAIDNAEKFIVLHTLPDFPLEVSVAQPVASVLGPWRRETFLRFALLTIATAVMLVLYRRMLGNWRALALSDSSIRVLNRDLGEKVEEVRRQLTEKEAILRETNHRVKNHLAQVVSLVNLARMEASTPQMEALEARLEGYRLLYEKLSYKPGEGERLDAGDYLKDLLSRLVEVTPSDRPVLTSFHAEFLSIPTKPCSALGLMLGELVTNSIKHAGCGEGELRIECSVRADREGLRMTYSDNGPGFDYPPANRSSIESHIGLILVESLVKQYEGTLTYHRNPGSRFEILLKTGEPPQGPPAA